MPRLASIFCTLLLLALVAPAQHAAAQTTRLYPVSETPLVLTLDEAMQLGLAYSYTVRTEQVGLEIAQQQVREAWGQLYPQLSVSSTYTRNVVQANPFAGSSAGGIFGALGAVEWLAFNEGARTDDDPGSTPISLGEFRRMQQEGLDAAGIVQDDSANPFGVANVFQNNISLSQKLFDIRAIWGIQGVEAFAEAAQEQALERQEQLTVDNVRQAYYRALLAQEQAGVVQQSVERTRETVREVAARVAQGVLPKYQRLSVEVALANLETQYVQTTSGAAAALDNLKLAIGIPVEQPIRLRGALDADRIEPSLVNMSADDATALAVERRPDLEQLRLSIALQRVNARTQISTYFPTLDAFVNLGLNGSVPSNRDFTISDPDDPFRYQAGSNGFFSGNYWDPSLSVGLRLNWTIFDGFQASARRQQQTLLGNQQLIQLEQASNRVRLEITQALRDLRTAEQQIRAQQQNVERAELNYRFAATRLDEGVATRLEERDASDQLDQSRLNLLQAVYDYLVAQSAFGTAVGMPLADPTDFTLTAR